MMAPCVVLKLEPVRRDEMTRKGWWGWCVFLSVFFFRGDGGIASIQLSLALRSRPGPFRVRRLSK